MNLNFKNILTESIIDDLNLSKLDKVSLKVFNIIKDDKFYYAGSTKAFDMTDGQRIIKASEMLNIKDHNYLFSVYDFWNQYADILFTDVPKTIPKKIIPFNEDYTHILGPILLTFYYNNYNNKVIYENENGAYYASVVSGDLEESIMEDMVTIEIRGNDPDRSIFCGMLPNKGVNKLGCDYISMDDNLNEFIPIYKDIKVSYEETIDTKYYNVKFPKDLSDPSLKKYFDDIMDTIINNMIIPNEGLIEDFISANTV
jgi:hypothetical protein